MLMRATLALFSCFLLGGSLAAQRITPPTTAFPPLPDKANPPKPEEEKGEEPGDEQPKRHVGSPGVLPNDVGQVWREYDLRPYTKRFDESKQPQQDVVDWVLRETGTEVWFNAPLGFMNATRDSLRVYHTPPMQRVVQDIGERFTSHTDEVVFRVVLLSVEEPDWRDAAHSALMSVANQSPGLNSWLLRKEDAIFLLHRLRQRPDCRDYIKSPTQRMFSGQSREFSDWKLRSYISQVSPSPPQWSGTQMVESIPSVPTFTIEPIPQPLPSFPPSLPGRFMAPPPVAEAALPEGASSFAVERRQFNEGYSLQFKPLLSLDGQTVDAVIRCQVARLERLHETSLDVTELTREKHARLEISVPQQSEWTVHERFRWPTNQVLLLDCGMVAPPASSQATDLEGTPTYDGSDRANVLLLAWYVGKVSQVYPGELRSGRESAGRYGETTDGAKSSGRY